MTALIPLEWALRPPCLFPICRLNYAHPRIQMTIAGSVSGQLSGSGIKSIADYSEASWTATWLLRSSNAGLALMAVTPATTAANEQPRVQRVRNFGMFQCEMPLKHPLCMQENPLCMHRTPSVWEFQGIPKKGPFSSREFQWEFQRFPTSGIPALGIPGN